MFECVYILQIEVQISVKNVKLELKFPTVTMPSIIHSIVSMLFLVLNFKIGSIIECVWNKFPVFSKLMFM